VLVAAAGIFTAVRFYVQRPEIAERMAARFPVAHRVLLNKYYVDELYHATFVRAVMSGAFWSWRFDARVVDGAVNGSGWFTRFAAWLSGLADTHVVDGAVNATGFTFREASHGFRRLQTGLVQNYALLMVLGVFAFVSVYLFAR
jgi:NADH-quinone oxidoreductase subunit L